MSSSSSAAAAPPSKICFNPLCKESKSEPARKKGWRLRSGELADLCDRCHSTYEQGIFCETFHLDAAGWRKCESCGKRLHCGCIISAPTYMLLDIGGVDCAACARKTLAMAPKQMLSSPLLMTQQASERMKNGNVKGRSQMIGSFPGPLRQAANMWNVAGAQSDLHQRLAFEFDRPRKMEDMSVKVSTSLNNVTRDRYTNGNVGLDSFSAYNTYSGEEVRTDILQDSVHLIRENDSMLTRKGLISDPSSTSSRIDLTNPNSHVNSLHSSLVKEDSTCSGTGVIAPFSSPNDTNDSTRTSTHRLTAPPMSQQMHSSPQSIMDSCSELQAQMRNGKPRVDARARAQLLPRYWPRLTDQELQQISGDSNSVITPLFEKMLSASDAGRIGRLVLPKKCAEAYFPPIFQPEGLPLKVQDATGKEWVFQFRFWPNNNSRMYVLEGVTPCIQTMQLQAGDTVTFSRIDPEGKLVMGFRKASIIPTEQDIPMPKAGNGLATPMEVDTKNTSAESIPNLPVCLLKESTCSRSSNKTADQGSLSTCDKSGYIGKNGPISKTSVGPTKRKGNTSGSKSKRLLMDHQESIQLKLTWEAAQDLLRPPPNGASSTVIIEGHEFEEYEEAPVIGMPTIFTTNQNGDKCQWAQCEDCSKWRRLPADALLPSRWTCSDNTWDPERSSCLSAQEPSVEQLFPPIKMGSSKRSKVKVENDSVEVEGSDGLDTLANLAILGEGDELGTSSQATTTKHPRHRPGCSCIVCIQPPSGKGPKHKPTCLCTVCSTVKRRFRTLMLRREQRLSEKEAETARQLLLIQSPDMDSSSQKTLVIDDGVVFEEAEQRKAEQSPVKAHIDLNMHPDREEDPSQGAAAARA